MIRFFCRMIAAGARRSRRTGDDEGSMMMAMLVVVVGLALSAVMTPMMLNQMTATTNNRRWVHELHAAETGIDVMMGHLRSANDGAGNGVLAKLPCGTMTGSVQANANERYQTTVTYYKSDPNGQSASWLANATNQVLCLNGGGAISTPAFALIQSLGTDQATGSFATVSTRNLSATYIFQTTNANIPGGAVHVFKTSTSTDMCFDAGSSAPTAGTAVVIQPCVSGKLSQKFGYNTNLTLVFIPSKTSAQPLGMCLDAGSPHAVNAVVKFQPCASVTSPQQQWSINDNANFEGTSDGTNLDGYCFNVQSPNTSGSTIILANGSNCHGGYDNIETFSPDAAVGAGAAGASSGQMVNFSEFGRCLDVTEQNVNYGYLIVWPCKQAPDPTKITWNQRYLLPTFSSGATSATGTITTNPGTLYCLQSPLSTAFGQYVQVVPCTAGPPVSQTWTVYHDTGVYSDSYVIKDKSPSPGPYCLQATDPTASPADLYPQGNAISKVIMATCNGSTLQKWNAPPGLLQPTPVKDYSEK